MPVLTENDDEDLVHQSTRDTYPSFNLMPLFADVVKANFPRPSSPLTFNNNESTLAVKFDSESDDQVPFVKPTISEILRSFNGNYMDFLISNQQARKKAKILKMRGRRA